MSSTDAGAGTIIAAAQDAQPFPVQAGVRYEMSVYVGLHRLANAQLLFQTLDAAGATTSFAAPQYEARCSEAGGTGGPSLAGYCRVWAISYPMPVGTATARFVLQTSATAGGPVLFFTRAFFGEAKLNQTEPSEWSPAGLTQIDGGMIITDAILARHIAAGQVAAEEIAVGSITGDRLAFKSIGADKINVTELSAITSNMGTLTAGTINGGTINGVTINGTTINGSTFCAPDCGTGNFSVSGSTGTVVAKSAYLGQASGLSTVNIQGHMSFQAGGSSHLLIDGSQFRITGLTGGFHVCNFNTGSGSYLYGCADNTAPEVAALTERVQALEAALETLTTKGTKQ